MAVGPTKEQVAAAAAAGFVSSGEYKQYLTADQVALLGALERAGMVVTNETLGAAVKDLKK